MNETERARIAMDLARDAHPWSFSIGGLVGGLFAVYLMSKLWEKLLFQRVMDDPVAGKLSSVGAGWLTASAIAGFGMADGGPYRWFAFVLYAVPAILIGAFAHRSGMKLREQADMAE